MQKKREKKRVFMKTLLLTFLPLTLAADTSCIFLLMFQPSVSESSARKILKDERLELKEIYRALTRHSGKVTLSAVGRGSCPQILTSLRNNPAVSKVSLEYKRDLFTP